MKTITVKILTRAATHNPQNTVVGNALRQIGYNDVQSVKVERCLLLEVEDSADLTGWVERNKNRSSISPQQALGVLGERTFILKTPRFSTLADSLLSATGKLPFPRPPSPLSAFIPAASSRGILRGD